MATRNTRSGSKNNMLTQATMLLDWQTSLPKLLQALMQDGPTTERVPLTLEMNVAIRHSLLASLRNFMALKVSLVCCTEVDKYIARFYELAKMLPHMVSMEKKSIDRYIWALISKIRMNVTSSNPTTLQAAIGIAYRLTNDVFRSSGAQKDKMVGRKDRMTNKEIRLEPTKQVAADGSSCQDMHEQRMKWQQWEEAILL
nr:zinc finger, CCHC-type, retrotransposon Gag domain protein [Tanacetum cinerariifolium]